MDPKMLVRTRTTNYPTKKQAISWLWLCRQENGSYAKNVKNKNKTP